MAKECWTCKHTGRDFFSVCIKCVNKDKWESREEISRPKILPEVVPYYEHDDSLYPEQIRVSFGNSKTIVYEIRVDQPAPVILENIKIIRRMKQGYVNKPLRRRGRK